MQPSPREQHPRAARAVLGVGLLWGVIAGAQGDPGDAGVRPRAAPLRLIETADGVSVLSNKKADFPPAPDAAAPRASAPASAAPPTPEPEPAPSARPPPASPTEKAPLPEAQRAQQNEPTRWGVYLVGLVVAIAVILAAYFARVRGS
jgi:hypothetical protein